MNLTDQNLDLAEAQRKRAQSMKARADAFAARLLPMIRDIQRHGAPSLRAIAETLNARGIPTARGRNVVGDAGLQRASARADKGVKWWCAGSDHSCFARDLREIV
jgi:hypothetical protein